MKYAKILLVLLVAMLVLPFMGIPTVAKQDEIPNVRVVVNPISEDPTGLVVVQDEIQTALGPASILGPAAVFGPDVVGAGTYNQIQILIWNEDQGDFGDNLPMPSGALYCAILRDDKVGTTTADPFNFWELERYDKLGVWATFFWDICPIDAGEELKISKSEPTYTDFWGGWNDMNEELVVATPYLPVGDWTYIDVYVLAHPDVTIGDGHTYKFRAVLKAGAPGTEGVVVVTEDATFRPDVPEPTMNFYIKAAAVIAVGGAAVYALSKARIIRL